jgi:hypothetical protein
MYVWIHNFVCILEDIFKLDIQQMSHCISVEVSVFLFVAIFALIGYGWPPLPLHCKID